MAHKRMFSKDITGSDAFRDMPSSSQSLYFHLGMEADDDGFLGNYKGLIRSVGSSDDDFKILLAKRFLLQFPSGIVVIKHWLINNNIRKDRYIETKYLDDKKLISIKENKAYTDGIPNGNQLTTSGMHRIGEDRIGEDRKEPAPKGAFEFDSYLEEMGRSEDRRIKLIAYFFVKKGLKFDNQKEVQQAIKRHIKAATTLEPFDSDKIKKAINECEGRYREVGWTLETVWKMLTK